MINKIKIERGKNMKILAVGDLIGSAGIRKLKSVLPELRKKEGIDFVIVNGENSAEGMGMTEKNFKEILEEKVDVITIIYLNTNGVIKSRPIPRNHCLRLMKSCICGIIHLLMTRYSANIN